MRLKRSLAVVTAAALALGGLALGASAATAAPVAGDFFVPVADFESPTNPAEETAVYNEWHFDPDTPPSSPFDQEPNGFIVPTGENVMAMLGNGNDTISGPIPNPTYATDLPDLADSLSVVSSDNSKIAFEIPVFYRHTGGSGNWTYTTLYKNATDTGDDWISTNNIVDGTDLTTVLVQEDVPTPIATIVSAMNSGPSPNMYGLPRAIGAGFYVSPTTDDVLVSSFSSYEAGFGETTTHFYDQPVVEQRSSTAPSTFVHSDDIRPDETTYEGWHEGVPSSDPLQGTYESIEATDHVEGLEVTGKSQMLFGYAPADRPQNALLATLTAGITVTSTDNATAAGFTAQIPLFFYTEGVIGQQFTTLRAEIPAGGVVDATVPWTTSNAIGSIPAGTSGLLYDTPDTDGLLSPMASYEILGHGFIVQSGSVLATSVSFNGYVHTFSTEAPVAPVVSDELADTGAAGGTAPFAIAAALALLVAGGTALGFRRLRTV